MLCCVNCVSPFDPGIQGESGILVVDGSVIKGRETQVITISTTSLISNPQFQPVSNCQVKIRDNTGNEFVFHEESPGKYVTTIDDAWLNFNGQFKMMFTTASGDEYESDYQRLLESYPVDSVYAVPESHYSSVTGKESVSGMRFYADLDVPESATRYYRWVPEETWENRNHYEIWGEYDGSNIKPFSRRDSLQRCWVTTEATGIYTASTGNLSANRIKKVPLHFVESNSPKLAIKYCASIRQYALNADAFAYWSQREKELNESGNIYTSQPGQPTSNIHNVNHPGELVMGYFWVASCAVKRVFASIPADPPGAESCEYYGVSCASNDPGEIAACLYDAVKSIEGILPEPPVYITVERNTSYNIAIKSQCVDCRALGGEARKPYFWE